MTVESRSYSTHGGIFNMCNTCDKHIINGGGKGIYFMVRFVYSI